MIKSKKKIPRTVIKKLNRDLAGLVPEEITEFSLGMDTMSIVRITKNRAPIYPQPKKFNQVTTLTEGSKHRLLGINEDYLSIVYDDKPCWVQRDHVELMPSARMDHAGWWHGVRETLIEKAIKLRNNYQNNPYIVIKGFSIELGISPSLNIDFEFKD
jgi:hypothetical protein